MSTGSAAPDPVAGTIRAARPSRWPAGTLAAAGTIPVTPVNAYATLVQSQGHHPANHRSAIPAREYESGSGHGHDAAPAGPPPPPPPPPGPGTPGTPCPGRPIVPAGGTPASKGALRRRFASAPGPLTPGTARVIWQRSRPWGQPGTPPHPSHKHGQTSDHDTNQAQEQQKLDDPLHMRRITIRRQSGGGPWHLPRSCRPGTGDPGQGPAGNLSGQQSGWHDHEGISRLRCRVPSDRAGLGGWWVSGSGGDFRP